MQGHRHWRAVQLPSWIHAAAGWKDMQRSAHRLCWYNPDWPQKAHMVPQLGPTYQAGRQLATTGVAVGDVKKKESPQQGTVAHLECPGSGRS